jgi:hypothetical protein
VIINHSHKFVFIHIPKAAGTTVTRTLSELTRYCDQEIGGSGLGEAAQPYYAQRFGLRKHSRAEEVMKVMGHDTYMSYFRFAFVRNPYTRLASAYHFLKSWDGLPERFRTELDRFADFESFLESDLWTSAHPGRGPDAIFQPQTRWLFSQGDKPEKLVQFVGKTETLTEDLGRILKRIGAGTLPEAGRSNRSPDYTLPEVWKPEWVERIQQEYRRDFKVFGYPMDPPTRT